ncbi:MAG: hypothetical protein ACLFUV_04050 [Methanomassiliicoccales archaeon]
MRNLIVLLDGATDERIPQLGGRTPLEAAEKPFIDRITSSGRFGCTDASSYTHLYLLGLLSQREGELPRGLIETLGFDLEVPPGKVAYRLSPAVIRDGWMEWGYNITPQEVEELKRAVADNWDLLLPHDPEMRYYKEGKGVITLRSEAPLDLPSPPVNTYLDMNRLGEFRDFVEGVSKETCGIAELPWQGGRGELVQEYRDLREKFGNMTVYSNSPSALGIGALLGMEKVWVDDLDQRLRGTVEALETRDVLLHMEEIDDVSHKREPDKKLEFLEEVDKVMERYLDGIEGVRISLTVDHGASSLTGQHLTEPVPFAVAEGIGDTAEISFKETSSGHVPLFQLLDLLYR